MINNQILRKIPINLPGNQSAFLWGARKTGKTTLLRQRFPKSLWFDFLDTHLYFELLKSPWLFRETICQKLDSNEISADTPVILDEVQKVPQILNEVHWLIENNGLAFIMSGSSAVKLRRGHANLLGGRAWRFELHPITFQEIPDLNLLHAMNNGLLPAHYCSDNARKSLEGYIEDYLTEEIKSEGLTRNLTTFSRFTDLLGFCNGELINFTSIGRDCGVNVKTVQHYFEILTETHLGTMVEPFGKHQKRTTLTNTPKFYLFDLGIAAYLSKTTFEAERGSAFGKAFEHFIFGELKAHCSYSGLCYPVRFWRTTTGNEVDFILGDGEIAIEVKGGQGMVDKSYCRHLLRFNEEFKPRRMIIVCNESLPRKREDGIEILPWRVFLQKLWAGEIIR
jgi:predicted AAA+ superfamily ATPase